MNDENLKDDVSQPQEPGSAWYAHLFGPQNKRVTLSVLAAILFIVGLGLTYNYISHQNNHGSYLMKALKNTLAQDKLKYRVDLSQKTTQEAGTFDQKLGIDGLYRKDAGLSQTANSTVTSTLGVSLIVESKWVVDAADSGTYVNIASFDTETTGDTNTKASNKMKDQIVANNNKLFNNVWSKYSNVLLRGTYSNTGVHGCAPGLLYKTLSSPKALQSLASSMADNVTIQKVEAASSTSVYTIAVNTEKQYDAASLYTKSQLYKNLVDCDPAAYSLSDKSANILFKDAIMTVSVDSAKKVITSINIKKKDAYSISLTLSAVDDVNIAIPKESTDILSDDALEKFPHFSYDFDHLSDVNDMIEYGACYNFEKYKDLLSAEAIKMCKQLQK